MRRSAFKVVVFLLLGAIVNVAVAWGLPTLTESWRSKARAAHEAAFIAIIQNPSNWSHESRPGEIVVTHTSGEAIRSARCWWFAIRAEVSVDNYRTTVQTGWPALAVGASIKISEMGSRLNEPPAKLLREPLWPGFAINTIFYAGLLWMMFWTPGKVRRMVRRRRGLCPACAYDLRGSTSPVCTECGAANSPEGASKHAS